jgi:ribonuclease HI
MQKEAGSSQDTGSSGLCGQANVDRVVLNIDGAARGNPGHAGIGAVVRDANGDILARISEYIGETTNNVAEYSALIFALQALAGCRPRQLLIRSDSELLVRQLNGNYKVKNSNIKVYFGRAKCLLRDYSSVEILHIERGKNKEADRLANEAIDKFLTGEKSAASLDELPQQQQLF